MPVSVRRAAHGLSAALPSGERDHSGEKREAAPGVCTAPGGGERLKTRGKPCPWGFGGGRGKPGEHPKTEATPGQTPMATTPQGAWPSVPPPPPLRPTRRRSPWERQAMSPGWRHEPHGDPRGAGPTRGRPLRPNGSRPDLRLPLRYRDRPGGAAFSPRPLPRLCSLQGVGTGATRPDTLLCGGRPRPARPAGPGAGSYVLEGAVCRS